MMLLIQPPAVQLNAPYPAPYYLKSFLAEQGLDAAVRDHSIALFERIFCSEALVRIFADARSVMAARPPAGKTVRYNASRFLSQEAAWISCIGRLADFLRGKDREFGHLLALANGTLPDGPRTEAFLESVEGRPEVDQAAILASAMLADLADFITVMLDPSFALVRYSETLATGIRSYSEVEKSLDGYILNTFYAPLLEDEWAAAVGAMQSILGAAGPALLAGFTVPFPGCLAGALFAARSAKARFGDAVRTLAGGGYVNTELRSIGARAFFDHIDFLCFDRGYGALAAVLDSLRSPVDLADRPLYKTIYRSRRTGDLVGSSVVQAAADEDAYARLDALAPARLFPDYGGVDFTRYLCPVDDANPMHRLWTDGRWLKAYLAHGCYWHACAFCDVQLDYIRGYLPTDVAAFFAHMVRQAELTGVRGVHLVDEAAPVASLLRLARLNRDAGLPLSFWGNIRFERAFTPDVAAILASGGLLGVSAGIEVASDRGFKRLGKGIGLEDVVRACAAFKESGILVHAYLIYGYWDQDEQELVDSAEVLRQLFAQELVDSAFWHKFVLTRHSRICAELGRGRHGELKLLPQAKIAPEEYFADNDLRFRGEDDYGRYTAPLDALLSAWMAGDTATPVVKAFPFPLPRPSVPADRVASLLDAYAADRDRRREEPPASDGVESWVLFLGSRPAVLPTASGASLPARLRWRYKLADVELRVRPESADQVADLLVRASSGTGQPSREFFRALADLLGESEAAAAWRMLRQGGLAEYGGAGGKIGRPGVSPGTT